MPLVITLVIAMAALALAGYLSYRLAGLQDRVNRALSGDYGGLEESLGRYYGTVSELEQRFDELSSHYERLARAQGLSSQKISLVRFNPFGDTGGDQSFSLAVLDAHDSGYVLTSIHGRQGTRVYVKPVDFGESKYPLSEEERQALAQARKRVAEIS